MDIFRHITCSFLSFLYGYVLLVDRLFRQLEAVVEDVVEDVVEVAIEVAVEPVFEPVVEAVAEAVAEAVSLFVHGTCLENTMAWR